MIKYFASIFLATIILIGVSQAQNLLPRVNLDLSPSVVRVGEMLHYDATNSRDSQGKINLNLEYRFQFTNSGPWTAFSPIGKGSFTPSKLDSQTSHLFRVEVRDRLTGATQRTFRNYRIINARNPIPPRIKLLTPPPFSEGQQIGFEASILVESVIDRDDILVRWDFNSDGIFDTPFQRDKRGFTVFSTTNRLSPTLEVQFPGGQIETVRGLRTDQQPGRGTFDFSRDINTLVLNPAQIQAPIVNVSPGTKAPTEDITFTFDASRTTLSSNSYLEFFIDGVQIENPGLAVKHRFNSPGDHVVRVEHCRGQNNPVCRTTEVNVFVEPNSTDFLVDFTAIEVDRGSDRFRISDNTYQAVTSQQILFTSELEFEVAGETPIFQFRWDFDGDGIFDTPFSNQRNAQYTYDRAGTFKPTLEVRDDQETVNQAVKTIVVRDNTPPTGSIRTQSWPNYVGRDIQFTVDVADKESQLSQIDLRFDLDGDGVWEDDFRPARSETFRYDQPGEYTVRVQLRDPQLQVTTLTRTLPIFDLPEPKIKVIASHRNQTVNQPIRLNAQESLGEGLRYEWKVLNDPLIQTLRGAQTSLRFQEAGEYAVELTITDELGRKDTVIFPVNIVEKSQQNTAPSVPGNPPINLEIPQINNLPGVNAPISIPSEFSFQQDPVKTIPEFRLTGLRPGL